MFKILTIITTKYAIQFKIAIPHTSLNVGILWTANNLFYFLIKHNTPKIRACKPEVNTCNRCLRNKLYIKRRHKAMSSAQLAKP